MERSKNCHASTDDRDCSLSTLRAQAGKPLRDVILEIYTSHWVANSKSIEFLKNLRCFIPSKKGDKRLLYSHLRRAEPIVTLLKPCLQVTKYVAISYPWNPSYGESGEKGGYQLPDRIVPVRDIVLNRTIRFIRYKQGSKGMLPFWIDQLSIDQADPLNHELGMQSMDLVYKNCTFAVGYLWVEIQTQLQVAHLSRLLSGKIIKGDLNKKVPAFEESIDMQTADEILDLIIRITDDQWWSRAWIFQEDYLAGTKMWLLIRHAHGLKKSFARNELGHLSGELVVKSEDFRKYATLFCLALCQRTDRSSLIRATCQKVLQRAGKYSIIYDYEAARCNVQTSMTLRIITDLNNRKISVHSDLLAITANVCGYDIRLVAAKNSYLETSLSLEVLTLCISNGELVNNDCKKVAPYRNVFHFLGAHAMNIDAPLQDGALTFIKHCRLSVSRLSMAGIHTQGILWKLSDSIRPSHFQQNSLFNGKKESQRRMYRNGLNTYQHNRLFELIGVLNERNKRRHKLLANELAAYLQDRERVTKHDEWPSSFAMNVMAACIVNAMDTGKYLQVAHPIGLSPREGRGKPYRALFVRDLHDMKRSGPTYVFTSWTPTNEQIGETMKRKTLAKYVSMEVSVDGDVTSGSTSLRMKRWTNGLCFFSGETKVPFVFAWPETLCD